MQLLRNLSHRYSLLLRADAHVSLRSFPWYVLCIKPSQHWVKYSRLLISRALHYEKHFSIAHDLMLKWLLLKWNFLGQNCWINATIFQPLRLVCSALDNNSNTTNNNDDNNVCLVRQLWQFLEVHKERETDPVLSHCQTSHASVGACLKRKMDDWAPCNGCNTRERERKKREFFAFFLWAECFMWMEGPLVFRSRSQLTLRVNSSQRWRSQC